MYDVLTIGSITQDVFIKVPESRLIKNPTLLHKLGIKTDGVQCLPLGSKMDIEQPVLVSGGGATNAAVTFSRQGFKTACVVKVGDDLLGELAVKELESYKVSMRAAVASGHPTDYSTILIAPDGSRSILVGRGASSRLTLHDLPPLSASWAYINPSNIPISVIKSIIKRLSESGACIALNPSGFLLSYGRQQLEPLLKHLTIVIVNREEASRLTGVSFKDEHGIFKKFDKLIPGLAVMTEGPKGVMVSNGKYLWRAGIFPSRKIVDRTGAGDAFGSGLVASLMRSGSDCHTGFSHQDVIAAIRAASANATSVVESLGAKAGILSLRGLSGKRFRRLSVTRKKL